MSGARTPARALWISEEPPDRAGGGGNIRQAHLFTALASVLPTDLLLVGELEDEAVRAAAAEVTELPRRDAPWPVNPVLRRALQLAITLFSSYPLPAYPAWRSRRTLTRALATRLRPYGLVCVEHEALAPLVHALPPARSIVTFHHLLSQMVEQELAHTPGRRQRWLLARNARKARQLEARALTAYDRVIACSEEDAVSLSRLVDGPAANVRVIANGVDLVALAPSAIPAAPHVLFPGSLAYAPNVDGALWLCSEVWPRVRAAVPAASLILAGREPVPEVLELDTLAGVSVRPNVESMAEYFRWSRAVVVPLRIGTGTRLKALEAMAAGRAVVGTAVGLAGIGVVDGRHAKVANDSEAMAAAIVEVLREDELAQDLARAARAHVEERFGWGEIGARFVATALELLRDAAGPSAGPGPIAADQLGASSAAR